MAADSRTEHLRLLLDLSPVPMLATELETGRVHAMNRYAERLFLVSQSEAQGRTTVELDFWKSQGNRDEYIAKVRSDSEEPSIEAQVDRKDGTSRHCILSSHILPDGLEPTLIVSTLQDITERKQAQDALRTSESHLQQLFENSFDGLWDWNIQTGAVFFSPRYYRILGYEPDEFVPDFRTWSSMLHPDDLPLAQTALRRHFDDPAIPYVVEFRMRHKDGSWIWIEAHGNVTERDDENRPLRMVGTHSDISRRKEAEEERAKAQNASLRSEKRLEHVIQSLAEGVVALDAWAVVVQANNRAHDIFALPEGILVGTTMFGSGWSLLRTDGTELPREELPARQTLRDGQPRRDVAFGVVPPEGKTIWISASSSILERDDQGVPMIVLVSFSDITERKRIEEAMIREQRLTEAIFNSVPGLIFLYDADGHLVRWNRKHELMTGYGSEELANIQLLDWYKGDEKSLNAVLAGVKATIEAGYGEAEAVLQTKYGTTIPMFFSAAFLTIDGKPHFAGIGIDITERKTAEDRYRNLFENLTTGFALHEVLQDESGKAVDYRFLEVNPAYETLTGLRAADIIGKKVSEAIPDIEQGWIETFGNVAVTGIPVRYENHVASLDKWYETWAYRPAPRQFAVFVTDVTERRKREEELRRSEENYRLLADNSTDVISRIAKDGTISYISPSIELALGWTQDHFLGKAATEGIHPDDIPSMQALATQARASGTTVRPIYRSLHKDGSWIWVEASVHPLYDESGALDGLIASSRDVTARIAAEQALKEREERLRLVLDATSDGIFDWDIPSGAVHYSHTIFTMLGYAPDEFPGTIDEWRSRVHPDDLPRTNTLLQAHLDDTSVLYCTEYRMRTKDGNWKWIMARGKVVARAPDGSPSRMVGTHSDITERKLTEKALAESEERFRFLAENSLDVVLRLDPHGTILWASPSLETVLDQDPVTSIGISSLASIHPDDQARIASEFAETLRYDGPRKAVYRHVTRKGKVFWVESIGRALHDPQTGSVEGLLVSTRDITEQKRQSELFEETQRLAHVGGWQFYFDTTTTVWTREMKRIFGLAPEDPPLPLETLKSLLEPQSLRLYEESFERLMRDGAPWDIPLRGRTIDGRLLLSRLTCDCERSPDGRFIAIRGSMQDVTESELLRERFESASRLNQSILSTTEALLVLLDLDGRIVRFNEACQRVSGWSETEMLGSSMTDALVPEDERRDFREMLESLVALRTPSQLDNHWVARDGRRFWISWVNSVIFDDGGAPLYVLCTGIDMTAFRATQLKLQETQERWRVLIETAPEAILILDAENYRFTQTNPAAEALFGITRDEILAHGPLEISPPCQLSGMTSRDTLDFHCRNALQGPATTFEWIHLRPGGREILCQVNLSRLPSEGHPLLRASVVDITERRKTESVLQSLVQRTSSLFGQAFFEALVRDLASLLEVRYAFVARITPDGSRIQTVAFVTDGNLAPSMSYPIAGSPCADVLENGMLFQASAIRERYPDSRILDALAAESYMAVPLRGVENQPIGILAVADSKPMVVGELAKSILSIFAGRAQGEMERHEAELALRRLNSELEQRVGERTAELVAMNRELESFAYSVSHDLRSPLRSINGFAQALSEDYGPSLDGEALGYLERIRNASHRMSELIDDLLSLSQSSRKALRKRDVDLSSMAAEILETLREGDPKRMVEFHVDPDLHAWADPVLMRAVMENLLGNSWKYTLRTEHPTIRFRYEPPSSGMAAFAVADNGAGFDMAFAQKLFGTFQRLHGADEFEGNGIGLATVKRILERHGGTIRGHGEIGKGATFVFELPVFAG